MKEKKLCPMEKNARLGTVGGQAVLEGVMMKSKNRYSVSVRRNDGTIKTVTKPYVSLRSRHKWLNIPILRGIINFFEMLILSYKTLSISAEAYATVTNEDGEKESLSKPVMTVTMILSVLLGLVLVVVLFRFLPMLAADGVQRLSERLFQHGIGYFYEVLEGIIKIAIFLIYLIAVSCMKDIRRTFEYHGAEHKSIFCYEAGEELTPANVKKYTRFHPRCGTSFLFVLMIVGVLLSCLPFMHNLRGNFGLRLLCQIGMLLPTIGIGYEFIMLAGKHPNRFTYALSAPGLWMQRITTREPDEAQIECAIRSLKCALREEFPEDVAAFEAEEAENEAKEAERIGKERIESTDTATPAEAVKSADPADSGKETATDAEPPAEAACDDAQSGAAKPADGTTTEAIPEKPVDATTQEPPAC